jgi:hypothetical protein
MEIAHLTKRPGELIKESHMFCIRNSTDIVSFFLSVFSVCSDQKFKIDQFPNTRRDILAHVENEVICIGVLVDWMDFDKINV